MAIKFKFSNEAADDVIDRVVSDLAEKGIKAEKLFPGQKRTALDRIYVVDEAGKSNIGRLERALEPYRSEIDYVEGEASRQIKKARRPH